MSRLRAWTWKEAREHRWALLGVLVTVALITVLPFVAFDETTREQFDQLPGLAVALATLVLGLDLFVRETRRSTHALILRTPGAMRWAFRAKLLVFGLGTLAALALEEGLRHPLEALTGLPRPYRVALFEGEWRVFPVPKPRETEFGVPIAAFTALLAAAVGAWHVAGSVVSPRAGVGALCGVLALGVLAVPLLLLNANHPWWFRPSAGETYLWLAGIGLTGLLAAGVGWYSGRRFLFPRRRAAVRAGLTALVSAALATGATAYAIDRWEAADPHAPEFHIHTGFLGEGGKTLYLTTTRGGSYQHYGELGTSGRQSPPTTYTVHLDDPIPRAADVRMGSSFILPQGIARIPALVPIPFVVRVVHDLPRANEFTDQWIWIDTASRAEAAHPFLPDDPSRLAAGGRWSLTPATIEAARATAKAQTPLRDSKGRRVWWIEGVVERDGDENRVPTPKRGARRLNAVAMLESGGFLVEGHRIVEVDPRGQIGSHERYVIDAETGESSARPFIRPPNLPGIEAERNVAVVALGDSKFLVRRTQLNPTGEANADSSWLTWDATKPDRFEPAPGGPTGEYGNGLFVLNVEEGTVLVPMDTGAERPAGGRALSKLMLWSPLTGERVPVESADASLLSPGWLHSVGVLPDGRLLLSLFELPGAPQGPQALALFDLAKRSLTPVAPWSARGWNPIAFDVDGSLLVIEGYRRVVRLSDGGTKREVVWPR